MTTKNDFIYIYHNEVQTEKVIKLGYQSGLLEEPKPQNVEEISYKVEKTTNKNKKEELKYDYEIKCLLIYLLKKGDLIELISNDLSTMCQIVEITDINDFVMTLKIRVINNESDIQKNNSELKNA